MKRRLSLILLGLVFVIGSCKVVAKESHAPPEEVHIEDDIFSLLVSKNGKVVIEEYYNGRTEDNLCDVQSLTKGLMSILLGIAIDKKYIKDVDEPIAKYFPSEYENLDDAKKDITIRHLLNQTSGLSWKGYLEHEAWLTSENPISFVLDKALESMPGERYNYNSGATHLLSVIISRAYGNSSLEFANEYLFNDLNIQSLDWQKRNAGYYDGSGLGLKMKPTDLMKLGHLLENNGNWQGQQIVSVDWIEKLFDEREKSSTEWGLRNSMHGFCWYKAEINGTSVDYGMGYGGQFIMLIPESDLIIVATHNHDTPNGIEQQIKFLNSKLPALIEKYKN